jgi:hypothetical protein
LVAALNGGEIPLQHKIIRDESLAIQAIVWDQRIFDAGLKVQNYDKGFERFVRKFDPDVRMEAVMSIVKDSHHDHGTAVFVTQEKRRCLLLDAVYGRSDEQAL